MNRAIQVVNSAMQVVIDAHESPVKEGEKDQPLPKFRRVKRDEKKKTKNSGVDNNAQKKRGSDDLMEVEIASSSGAKKARCGDGSVLAKVTESFDAGLS